MLKNYHFLDGITFHDVIVHGVNLGRPERASISVQAQLVVPHALAALVLQRP